MQFLFLLFERARHIMAKKRAGSVSLAKSLGAKLFPTSNSHKNSLRPLRLCEESPIPVFQTLLSRILSCIALATREALATADGTFLDRESR